MLIMKERRHMIPEAIRGMEKPIERALASGACVESGRHLIELTPSGHCLAKTSYTCRMNDLAQSWIQIFPLKFLP